MSISALWDAPHIQERCLGAKMERTDIGIGSLHFSCCLTSGR